MPSRFVPFRDTAEHRPNDEVRTLSWATFIWNDGIQSSNRVSKMNLKAKQATENHAPGSTAVADVETLNPADESVVTSPIETPVELSSQEETYVAETRTEQPPTEPPSAYARSNGLTICPKCGVRSSWGEASWCPSCAYYPELNGIVQDNPELQMAPEEQDEPRQLSAEERYRWILICFGGVGVALLLSMAVRVYFYYNDGPRGQWTIVQTLVGLGCFATGQLLATFYSMSKTDDVTLVDAVNRPLTVWKSTIDELPFGAFRIYAAVWGLSIALFAMLCIGGVTSEMIFGNTKAPYRGKKINLKKMAQSAAQPTGDEEGMTESLEALAEQVEVDEESPLPFDGESPMSCQVYGFMRGGSETSVSRLLLCGLVHGELKHVAVVGTGKLKAGARQKLRAYLNSNTRSKPLVDTKYRGTWVNPVVAVVVKFDGWSPKNEMIDPEVAKISRASTTKNAKPRQPQDTPANGGESSAGESVDLDPVVSALSQ